MAGQLSQVKEAKISTSSAKSTQVTQFSLELFLLFSNEEHLNGSTDSPVIHMT